MSRDFLLVLGGGVVSLVTTLIVLFITDWIYRRDQARTQTPEPRLEGTASAPTAEEENAS